MTRTNKETQESKDPRRRRDNKKGWGGKETKQKGTHDVIDTKDSTNIHTRIDIAAPIEGIKDDAVFASVTVVDENCLFEFFRNEDGSLS